MMNVKKEILLREILYLKEENNLCCKWHGIIQNNFLSCVCEWIDMWVNQ